MNRRESLRVVADVMLVVSGAFLIAVTVALLIAVIHSQQDTIKNREVGCISRYLDGQEYAPACQEFIDEFVARR